jgi:DNA adenine methylase
LFPQHTTYCEPFGGSGAVLLAKEPSRVEILSDLDGSLVNLFHASVTRMCTLRTTGAPLTC